MLELSRRRFFTGAAGAAAATVLAPFAAPSHAAAPLIGKQAASFYRSKLGDFEVTIYSDGVRVAPPPPNYVRNASNEQVLAAAEAAYMPKGNLIAPFNPLVVNTGSKLVLMDTGFGPGVAPTVGLLTSSMSASGIDPKAIDIVLISHMHGDHILGLKNADGSLAFPNAEIKVPATDWAFWMSDDNMAKYQDPFNKAQMGFNRKIFGDLKDKVTRYEAGKEVAPGITSVATYGHTPGHSSFIIASGNDTVFVQSDVTNLPLFVRNPGWHLLFDQDANMAEATRRKVYDMLAADKMMVQAFHYPFPARAYIEKTSTGYRETMVPWSPTL